MCEHVVFSLNLHTLKHRIMKTVKNERIFLRISKEDKAKLSQILKAKKQTFSGFLRTKLNEEIKDK